MTPDVKSQRLIDHRFREVAFRKYEEVIRLAVQALPSIFECDPSTYKLPPSIVTCTARCRDALHSLYKYQWETSVDLPKFREAWQAGLISVGQSNGRLLIGPKEAIRLVTKENFLRPQAQQDNPFIERRDTLTYQGQNPETDLHLLAWLVKQSALSKNIFFPQIDPLMVSQLQDLYDVVLDGDEEHGYTLIS